MVLTPLSLSLSCGDSGDDEVAQPLGAVAMNLGKLHPRGGDGWKPGDAEPVILGCDRQLGVTVTVWDPVAKRLSDRVGPTDPVEPPDIDAPEYQDGTWSGDWLFRPPGACTRKQCGTLRVSVTPSNGGQETVTEAALDTAVVDLSALDARFEGSLSIRAELRENGGETVGVYDGVPLLDAIELDVVSEQCEGGTGGTGGTGGGSGSGNQGGEAGSPEAGGAPGAGGASGGAP